MPLVVEDLKKKRQKELEERAKSEKRGVDLAKKHPFDMDYLSKLRISGGFMVGEKEKPKRIKKRVR